MSNNPFDADIDEEIANSGKGIADIRIKKAYDRIVSLKKTLQFMYFDNLGLQADLVSLIKVCRTGDIERIKRFVELNYPEGGNDDK